MEIAYISMDPGVPVYGNKGCSIHVQEVLRVFKAMSAEIHLFTVKKGKQFLQEFNDVKLHLIDDLPKGDASHRELKAMALNIHLKNELEKQGGFDLIYERYSLWSYAAMQYGDANNIPSVLEVNSPLINEQKTHRELIHGEDAVAITKKSLNAADSVISVSDEVRKDYVNKYIDDKEKVHVISNGVNTTKFNSNIKPSMPSPKFTLGFVGSLKPWHGLDNLIEIFSLVNNKLPESRLLVVGDGTERDNLERKISEHDLAEKVVITGAVSHEQIPGLIASMDVALAPYPSTAEFYFSPLKIFEYMACGVAVVASDAGQISNIIKSKHDGLLCKAGDDVEFAQKIIELHDNSMLRKKLSKNALNSMEPYSWNNVVKKILGTVNIKSIDTDKVGAVK